MVTYRGTRYSEISNSCHGVGQNYSPEKIPEIVFLAKAVYIDLTFQWLKLRLDEQIPLTLLLLSRVMTLPSGPTPSYEDLRNALAHLPDSLVSKSLVTHHSFLVISIDYVMRCL